MFSDLNQVRCFPRRMQSVPGMAAHPLAGHITCLPCTHVNKLLSQATLITNAGEVAAMAGCVVSRALTRRFSSYLMGRCLALSPAGDRGWSPCTGQVRSKGGTSDNKGQAASSPGRCLQRVKYVIAPMWSWVLPQGNVSPLRCSPLGLVSPMSLRFLEQQQVWLVTPRNTTQGVQKQPCVWPRTCR